MATALIASTLLTGPLPVGFEAADLDTGIAEVPAFSSLADLSGADLNGADLGGADFVGAGLGGTGFAAVGFTAGLGAAFLAGAECLTFDFAADFVAITILCAAPWARRIAKRAAPTAAPPKRIKASSLGRAH
jgi:hypothetical protein